MLGIEGPRLVVTRTVKGFWALAVLGDDGVADAAKSLGNQGRTDGSGGVTAAQRQQLPSKACWHRRGGKQVPGKVNDIAQIVLMAYLRNSCPGHHGALLLAEPNGSANSRMQI